MIKRVISKIKRMKPVMRIRYRHASEIVDINPDDALKKLQKLAPMPKSTALTHNEILPPKYDLTVIVPAYNAEQWIRQCVDSIIMQQTHYSFIAIIVDDGSTDKTGEILDSYLPNNRLKVIHQENKGYSGARNVALKRIESQFIMFVDSDDYILPNAIELLLRKAHETGSDIAEGNGYTFGENGKIGKIKTDCNSLWGGPCLKIIKSDLFRNIEFPECYLYEDSIIGYIIGKLSKKTFFVDDEVYAYRVHQNSITQKHTDDLNRIDSFWIMLAISEWMKPLNVSFDYDNYMRTMRHILRTYRRTVLLSNDVKKSIFSYTKVFLTENYSEFLQIEDKYKKLTNAIMKNDYGQYSFVCSQGFDF